MPRALAVCGVLLGLFLMHGAPASAAQGCHGAALRMAPMTSAAPTADPETAAVAAHGGAHGNAPAEARGKAPGEAHHAAQGEVHRQTRGEGGTCWATPARSKAPLAGWTAVGAAVPPLTGAGPTGRTPEALGGGWRGPPSGGRAVLLRVCVART